jgi:hypothetical protein
MDWHPQARSKAWVQDILVGRRDLDNSSEPGEGPEGDLEVVSARGSGGGAGLERAAKEGK